MSIDALLTHFDRLIQTPEAVSRLRRFILDLAVRGKLVPQNPADEPASELLKRIAAEKARLVKAGGIRKERTEPILSGDRPFKLPASWRWVAFGELHTLIRGVTYSKSDVSDSAGEGYLPILRANNIAIRLNHENPVFVKRERISPDQFLRRGDFMIALSSGSKNLVGKAAFVPDDFNEGFGGFCGVIRLTHTSLQGFVGVYLQSNLYRDSIAAGSRGIGINNLKKEKLSNLYFPLPPLAEQRRIVAKVDELMGLCDRLEAAQAERETTRSRLAAASLARLNAPDPDPATFRQHVAFALDNFTPLTTHPEQVKALRQTILNLAVRGKLVPQDPADEPASVLLKRIAAEKARLVKVGEIRKPKAIPALREEELPFSLPANWQWSQIAEIGLLSPRNEAADDIEASFVPMPMIAADYGVTCSHEVRQWGEIKKGYTHFAEGDVGLAKITPCFQNGKSTVFRNLTGGLGSGTTELHIVRPLFIDPNFAVLFLKSPHFIKTGIPKMTGTAGQKRVPTEYFAHSPFPLPPLAEQRRIVAKMDELMGLCDRLEGSLAAGEGTGGRLVDAMLYGLL